MTRRASTEHVEMIEDGRESEAGVKERLSRREYAACTSKLRIIDNAQKRNEKGAKGGS